MRLISCHLSRTLYFIEAALYKVSIDLPVANRHRDLTEKLLKVTLHTHTKKKNLKESRTCVQKRWTYQIPFNTAKTSEKGRFSLTAVHAFGRVRQWRIQMGFGGSNDPPLEPKLFHFHGEFQEKLDKPHKSNPPQLI